MHGSEKRTARATLFVLLSSCGFGSLSVLTTIATRSGTPLPVVMLWRYLLAAIPLGALAWLAERSSRGGAMRLSWKLIVTGVVAQTGITYVTLRSLDYISVATLAFLFYTYPAWVAIFSALRGLDRITPVRVVALVAALAGVAIIVGSPTGAHVSTIGIVLALTAAVGYGIYLPVLGELQRGMTSMSAAFQLALGAALGFAIITIGGGHPPLPTSARAWEATGLIALVSTAAAFWLVLRGLELIGPVRTAIVATVEPFYTTVLGALVLGDALSARTLAGGALIAAAVIVIQRAAAIAPETAAA